jgi:HK97 family phage portal protein
LNDAARKNIRESLERLNSGPANAGRPMLLEEGMKWSAAAFSAEDAELLESRKLSNEDVFRIFGVPPACVGISNAVSYGSAQQASLDLVTNTLAPLAARMEQAFMRCLLSEAGRRRYVVEFDLASLLRGDQQQIWNVHKVQREIGATSVNEIRRIHNQPPIAGGDDFTPLRTAPQPAEPPIATVKP